MTDPVLEETFNDTGDAIIKEKTLEPGKTYYWQVTAYGLAKNDTFTLSSDVYSFKTRDEGALNYESVNYVLGILDGYISDYEDGAIEFSDDTMYDGLVALSESTKTTIENATTKEEIDLCETEIIEKLIEAENCVSERIAEITECYVEQDSDNVYIKGTNFKNNSMISVLVTNPGNSIDDVEGASLSQIQYMDTVYSNGNGDISFSFKTRLNGKDRSGDYTVYIRNADGKTLTKTYNYGIISAGDITYKNADGEVIPDISECSGEQITMYCTITNDTQNDITPEIVTAFYNGSKLVDVSVDTSEDDARKVVANSKKELSWNVNVDTEGVTQIKVMFIESMITLKPLTSYRVIYEKE